MGVKFPQTALVLAFAVLALSGCATAKKEAARAALQISSPQEFIDAARGAAVYSMQEKGGGAKDSAIRGIEYAERCVALAPDNAACYYWRAVNTGLYHRVRIVGYQRGVKKMIADCERVIALDESYDYAGAYRILGGLYTQLPQTGGAAESVVRDLPLAEKYLRRAVVIAPEYPENYISLAETLVAEEKFSDAIASLKKARALVPEWKNDSSYRTWQTTILALEKEITKASK